MMRSETSCDESLIQAFLDERMSAEEQRAFEQHLSDCRACREQLQEVAAAPDIWTTAQELLIPAYDPSPDIITRDEQGPTPHGDSDALLESLAPSDEPEMLGRIGDYEIMGVVGIGGMGAVLKGFDKSLRRVVAIKVMAAHLANSGPARQRFQREARAAAAITHDNVIDIYAVLETNRFPYLVMPYARGPSLQRRIDESGPLSTLEVVRIGRQIASGLSAAHDQGLVHRDIKPANILLNDGIERLWITDFGVARAIDDVSVTQTGVIAGTPLYMSPEQARGESVDHRSDLFSLGSILYAVCTGRPPFRSDTAYGILRRITDTDPHPIQDVNPEIPAWLCRIIGRLMAKHPADRFETADEVAKIFEDCLAHLQRPNLVQLPECLTTPSFPAQTAPISARRQLDTKQPRIQRLPRTGVWLMATFLTLFGFGLAALQLTQPSNISGKWSGESWSKVTLSSAEEAEGWYTGSFTTQAGERGVVHLEWSRLKRRYVGRWRVGTGSSGAINLRTSANGQMRGAVSVDADSKLAPNEPRLRDFVWERDHRADSANPATSLVQDEAVRTIGAPVPGVIVKMGADLRKGAAIKPGDLIALIAPADEPSQEQRGVAIAKLQQKVLLARTKLESEQQKEMAMNSMLLARETQLTLAEKSNASVEESFKASQVADTAKLEGMQQEIEALKAEYGDAKRQHEIAERVAKQGIVSKQEVDSKAAKRRGDEAKLAMASAALQEAELRLRAKQQSYSSKRDEGLMKVSQAKVNFMEAKANLAEMTGQVARASIELKQAEQELAEIRNRAEKLERFEIRSPVEGQILSVISPASNQTVKAGDVICRINVRAPEADDAESHDAVSEEIKASQEAVKPSSEPAANAPETFAVTGLADAFGTASDLSRRFREARYVMRSSMQGMDASKRKLAAAEKELLDLKEKLEGLQRYKPPAEAGSNDSTSPEAVLITQQKRLVSKQIGETERKIDASKQAFEDHEDAYKDATNKLKQAEDEQQTIIDLLQVRIEAKRQKQDYQNDLVAKYRVAFEHGRQSQTELARVEQEAIAAGSELKQLIILFEHYKKLGR